MVSRQFLAKSKTGGAHVATHSFNTLMRRLSRAGFSKHFVSTALLPDWWQESSGKDPAVLTEVEIRVARFLNISLSSVRNAEESLGHQSYGDAQLRMVRDIDRDRLGPAIHAAIRVAEAVVRNLRTTTSVKMLPVGALDWRSHLIAGGESRVQLGDMIADLWSRGIPVIHMDTLLKPSFQGLACIVGGHPAIVLGHNYDEPGRVAFLVAHEAGHIVAGDCSPNGPVVDEDEAIQDGSIIETAADQFAKLALLGEEAAEIAEQEADPKRLAQQASQLEIETGADASSIIYSWAARTLNYAAAAMAVRALYRSVGARREIRNLFDQHVASDIAAESDRELLRCVYGAISSQTAVAR